MSIWAAASALKPRWVDKILLAAALSFSLAPLVGKWGLREDIAGGLGWMPNFLGINNPMIRLGIALIAAWIVLSIILTIATRMRIYRENLVKPKC